MTYNIKIVSQKNAIVLILILLTVFIGGMLIFFPHRHGQSSSGIIMVMVILITYFLWQQLVTGRAKWTIDENSVSMVWIKQFSFSNKEDINLKWSEIKSIEKGSDRNYYNLKIELVSGQKLQFFHDTLTTRDDFKEFIKILNQTFAERKATGNSSVYKIVAER